MKKRYLVSDIIKYVFLSILVIISVFPFLWMIICATNNTGDINRGTVSFGSELMTNLKNLFASDTGFLRAIGNSAVISVITTVIAMVISSLAGYGFEIFRSKARDRVFNVLLLSMMIPFATLMIPLFKTFGKLNDMGLNFIGLNSYASVIVPSVSTAFLIFFFRQNTKSFPKDII